MSTISHEHVFKTEFSFAAPCEPAGLGLVLQRKNISKFTTRGNDRQKCIVTANIQFCDVKISSQLSFDALEHYANSLDWSLLSCILFKLNSVKNVIVKRWKTKYRYICFLSVRLMSLRLKFEDLLFGNAGNEIKILYCLNSPYRFAKFLRDLMENRGTKVASNSV